MISILSATTKYSLYTSQLLASAEGFVFDKGFVGHFFIFYLFYVNIWYSVVILELYYCIFYIFLLNKSLKLKRKKIQTSFSFSQNFCYLTTARSFQFTQFQNPGGMPKRKGGTAAKEEQENTFPFKYKVYIIKKKLIKENADLW